MAAGSTELAPQELRVLVAVADTGGFSAAATALGIGQSAVSHSVRGSETKVGAVLFERGRAGATPTPAGERAVTLARRILRLYEVLGAEARGAGRGAVEGTLRIAAFRSAALHLLPPALERLAALHPGIRPEVRVVREIGAGAAGEVLAGRADLGIATLDAGADARPELLTGELVREAYALVHPVGHPDPRSLPLLDWDENCGSYTRAWWRAQDWIPRATVKAEDDAMVLTMVGRGLGMAILPELSLSEATEAVEITDLGPERPMRRVGYVTTAESASTLAVRALIRELRANKG
ncbi:LysR family transcriptional regulator [Streptomyces sp. WM4235]|uniref:LysR family transcriptional regulator n=1 Tax=unclassified Streptomyces TaxID=2593676 RepID=UPI0006B0255C|nr:MULTISPECIES: LysR family transcriptional regulator [unclassified Streptomyces]KOU58674.1 LysR family transcriptional regulator [Streptomyces sp. WM4235]MCX5155276.1 LysR family transcriptional regulator [Streptomyces sp. NBC_00291]